MNHYTIVRSWADQPNLKCCCGSPIHIDGQTVVCADSDQTVGSTGRHQPTEPKPPDPTTLTPP